MYRLDKIMERLNQNAKRFYIPKSGDVLVGQYVQDVTPSGMNETFMELDEGNVTVYIPKTKPIEAKLTKLNINVGDHIAIKFGDRLNWSGWNVRAHDVHIIKLQKVGDYYE